MNTSWALSVVVKDSNSRSDPDRPPDPWKVHDIVPFLEPWVAAKFGPSPATDLILTYSQSFAPFDAVEWINLVSRAQQAFARNINQQQRVLGNEDDGTPPTPLQFRLELIPRILRATRTIATELGRNKSVMCKCVSYIHETLAVLPGAVYETFEPEWFLRAMLRHVELRPDGFQCIQQMASGAIRHGHGDWPFRCQGLGGLYFALAERCGFSHYGDLVQAIRAVHDQPGTQMPATAMLRQVDIIHAEKRSAFQVLSDRVAEFELLQELGRLEGDDELQRSMAARICELCEERDILRFGMPHPNYV